MPYETFKRTTQRTQVQTLSIETTGRIALSAAATRIAVGHGIDTVLVLWDKERSRLALKATTKTDKNGYKITPSSGKASLSATTFLRHIGWSAQQRENLEASWNEKEKMFEAVLPAQYLGAQEGSVNERRRKA
jgi:hypothetical protein